MEGDQARMRQLSRQFPTRKTESAIFWSRRNNFNSSLYRKFTLVPLREKYRAVFRSAYVSKQRKLPVNDLTFPLFPGVGHDSTLLLGVGRGVLTIVATRPVPGVKPIRGRCP